MGVPSFFAWLIKRYKKEKFIIDSLPKSPKSLYVDANCLFHPQCFKLLGAITTITETALLESMMIKRIIEFLTFLENHVAPTGYMYIAVDGVAPLAKIGQQRKRRYRTIDDTIIKNNLKQQHNIPTINQWSNTVISPGTEFMEKLHRELLSYYTNKKPQTKISYIYSSYHVAGEGEHKILQHIKHINKKQNDMPIVIYGLDADLIFLALASNIDNIYLLREVQQLNSNQSNSKETKLKHPINDVSEEMSYVNIDIVKQAYNNELYDIIKQHHNAINDNEFLNDFIVICFLLGNDFLPHFPSLDIKKHGLEYVIDAYVNAYIRTKKHIITINDGKIFLNKTVLGLMLIELGNYETEYFNVIIPEFERKNNRKVCNSHNEYDIALWNMENKFNNNICDTIQLGKGKQDEWKFRYYSHHYSVSEHYDELVNDMSRCYLDGIIWVATYYFTKCEDWQWQYVYNHVPFVSDVAKYIMSQPNIIKTSLSHKPSMPIMTQLMSILPPQCSNLIPKSYRKLVNDINSPIIDMFPTSVKLDTMHKDQLWQCIPLIPTLDIERILLVTKDLELDKDEKIRNTSEKDISIK